MTIHDRSEHIEFSMTFDAPVTVTGDPTFASDLDADVAGGHLRFRRDDRDHGHRQRGGGGGGRSRVPILADRYGRSRQ